jgi:hypothetical protein
LKRYSSLSIYLCIDTSITSLEDELIYKSELDVTWRVEILSAPQAVFFLGQLIIASSKREMSLQRTSLNYQYKYIRHPNSLHATVLQIANRTLKLLVVKVLDTASRIESECFDRSFSAFKRLIFVALVDDNAKIH